MSYPSIANPIGYRKALRDLGDGSYAEAGVALLPSAGLNSYFAFGEGYAAYATPTDMLTIQGSASKIIRINNALMRIGSTSGALHKLHFIKRTAANTAGTFAAQTAIKLDTGSPAASAVINLYSVIPSGLGAGVTLAVAPVVTTVLTAAPAIFSMGSHLSAASAITTTTPVILRGASEWLALNWNGAAIPAGFLAHWEISWTESDV